MENELWMKIAVNENGRTFLCSVDPVHCTKPQPTTLQAQGKSGSENKYIEKLQLKIQRKLLDIFECKA
jgi:hypothetical protein